MNAQSKFASRFTEPADPQEDRFDQLDDLVSTTAQAFLGLTLGCARCHDHKLEPLTMHDYYRMAAVFRPLQRPREGRTELDLPALPRAQLATVISSRLAALGSRPAGVSSAFRPVADPPRGYFLREPSPRPGSARR